MMKEEMVNKAYALAKERYAEIGGDIFFLLSLSSFGNFRL